MCLLYLDAPPRSSTVILGDATEFLAVSLTERIVLLGLVSSALLQGCNNRVLPS